MPFSDSPAEGAAELRLNPAIRTAIARGTTILTVNSRHSQRLAETFARDQQGLGVARWTPPAILPIDAWAAGLWRRAILAGHADLMLLNRSQEQSLWLALIERDPQVSALTTLDTLADLASDAARVLASYNGRTQLRSSVGTDSRAFAQWLRAFDQECSSSAYLPLALLPSAVEALLEQGQLDLDSPGLLLVDAGRLTPSFASLFTSIERAGYHVERIETASSAARKVFVHEATDAHQEIAAAARWARATLEQQPAVRIAIVCPDLAKNRAAIDRVFEAQLAPGFAVTHAASADRAHADASDRVPASAPYEFLAGDPLARVPAVVTALGLLTIVQRALPLEQVSRLLLSRAFGSEPAAEALAVAEFDAHELRRMSALRPEVTLAGLLRLLERSPRLPRMPRLHERVVALRRAAAEQTFTSTRHRGPAEWAESFREVLRASEWGSGSEPGTVSIAHADVYRQMDSALDELATLGFDGSRLPAAAALGRLHRIVTASSARSQRTEAPIQILAPADVGAVPFDALWFLSAGDQTWPAVPALNPLLPRALQRALGVPGADAARDQADAQRMAVFLAGSAAQAVFSYAAATAEGHQRLSPVVAALTPERLDLPASLFPPPAIELVVIEDDPLLPPLPDRASHGGSEILALQAACPFRAFAEKRLGSSEPDTRSAGLDARERGNIVHRVMEHFWTGVETQTTLRAMTHEQVQQTLQSAIEAALEGARTLSRTSWDRAYVDTQAARLERLLMPWLKIELSRPPFSVLAREERREPVAFGPLRLRVRIDRTDQTASGPLILDYKTGAARPPEWLSERPDSPQLPLYALLSPEPVAGVAFALLRAGDELHLKGFADHERVFGKTAAMAAPTLHDQVEQWRAILWRLAEDFAAGEIQVSPKNYPLTCKYCTQRTLCRLDPTTLDFCEEEEVFSGPVE